MIPERRAEIAKAAAANGVGSLLDPCPIFSPHLWGKVGTRTIMADRTVLFADHEALPLLQQLALDQGKLIDVVRIAAGERALCTRQPLFREILCCTFYI